MHIPLTPTLPTSTNRSPASSCILLMWNRCTPVSCTTAWFLPRRGTTSVNDMLHLKCQTPMLLPKVASGSLNACIGTSMDITLESYSTAGATMTSNCSQIVQKHLVHHSISPATAQKSKIEFIIYQLSWQKATLIIWSNQVISKMFMTIIICCSFNLFMPSIKSKRLQHQWFALILRDGARSTVRIATLRYIGLLLWESSFKPFPSFVRGKSHNLIDKLQRLMAHFSKTALHQRETPKSQSDHRL